MIKLETAKELLPQFIVTLIASASCFSGGMSLGWTSPTLPKLRETNSTLTISSKDEMFFESIYMLSGLAGLPFAILLVDRIGRKKLILMASIIDLSGWLLISLTSQIQFVYVFRVLSGISADINVIVLPMYVGDIASEKFRGFLLGFGLLLITVGINVMFILGPYTPIFVPPIICIVLLSIQITTIPFMPESPYFLLMKGERQLAEKALLRLRPNGNIETELECISETIAKNQKEKGGIRDLFLVASNRKAFFLAFVLLLCQQLAGPTVFVMNLHSILMNSNTISIDKNITGIAFSSISLLAIFTCVILVDKYGRRVLLITSGILSGISMIVLAIYFHLQQLGTDLENVNWIPAVAVTSYAWFFKVGLGIIPQTFDVEVFPNNIKSIGLTIMDAVYMLSVTLVINFYEFFVYGDWFFIPFYVFGGVGFFVAIFTVLFIPETKGRTFEEIQEMLKSNSWCLYSKTK